MRNVALFVSVTVLDARNMEFIPNQCFDLIIDKGMMNIQVCFPFLISLSSFV